MFEIERKFLTDGAPIQDAIKAEKITQGFMSTDPERTIRVRLVEGLNGSEITNAYLTVKGKMQSFTRREVETEIDFSAASALLQHFCKDQHIIEKVRYTIPDSHGQLWEVDVFKTNNRGLIIAELELASEDQKIILSTWITGEVTNDYRYSNAQLSMFPYPFISHGSVRKR